jgi:hypothetical protein
MVDRLTKSSASNGALAIRVGVMLFALDPSSVGQPGDFCLERPLPLDQRGES